MECLAADPGDMDFCLQCQYYFECDFRNAVPADPVLESDLVHFMEEI